MKSIILLVCFLIPQQIFSRHLNPNIMNRTIIISETQNSLFSLRRIGKKQIYSKAKSSIFQSNNCPTKKGMTFSEPSNLIAAFLFLFVIQGFFSCASKFQNLVKATNSATIITYEKEKSRGNLLPLFSMEFKEGKVVKYTGIANVPVMGEHIIEMKEKEFDHLINQFKAVNFNAFEKVYKGRIRDLPLTSISYDNHKVTFQKEACPEKLDELVVQIVALIPTE